MVREGLDKFLGQIARKLQLFALNFVFNLREVYSMTIHDNVEQALVLLENIRDEESPAPAMIILPPDTGQFIIGNSPGLIKLAIASLRAAGGEEQTFKGKSWVSKDDLDWGINGLRLDPSAHIYLRPKQTKFQRLRNNSLSLSLLVVILICTLVGFIALACGIYKMIW